MGIYLTLALNGIVNGSLYFLMAAGLTLIFGLMRVVNFAHGGLYLWGAYLAAFTFVTTGNFTLALAAGAVVAIVLGVVMERGLIAFVYHNENGQLLVTMGIMLILTELIKVPFGPSELSANTPNDLSNSWLVGQVVIVQYQLFMIAASVIVFLLLLWVLHKTRLGMIVRAGVYNPDLVEACGIAIRRVFTMVFAVGAGLAGLAGAIAGPYLGAVTPTMGFDMQLNVFIIVVVGGLGSLTGSFVASMLIGILTAVVSFYFSSLAVLVNVLVMVVVLLIRPQGLFGERESPA